MKQVSLIIGNCYIRNIIVSRKCYLIVAFFQKGYYNSQADRKYASLAQLDRASGYGPEGQGFEFSTAHQPEPKGSGFFHSVFDVTVYKTTNYMVKITILVIADKAILYRLMQKKIIKIIRIIFY